MLKTNKSIFSYNLKDLSALCAKFNQPSFRAKQLIDWLYKQGVQSFDEMSNMPKTLRHELAKETPLVPPRIIDKQISYDETRKYVIEYADGTRVESVGMPSGKNLSVCFSTQAGCPMQCAFCATGAEGLARNLSSGEMIAQLLMVQRDFQKRISHAVSMGQGEPFLNYEATLDALHFINNKQGFGIGSRHIALSTCGIVSGIEKLSQEPEQFTLAISLHAARQKLRNKLMPRCSSTPLPELKKALQQYVFQTNRRVSLEYLMLSGINDQTEDLEALKQFCAGLLCHINLIPFNGVDNSPFQASPPATQKQWVKSLSAHNIQTTIRHSRGTDIDGACGQLKNKLS